LPRPRAGLMSSGDNWLRLRSGRSSRLLGPGSRRRPLRRWSRRGADRLLRGGDPPTVLPSEVGSDSAEGGVDAEGAAAPPLMSDPARTVYLVVCVCFLRPPRPKHIVCWGLVLKCYELRTRQHKMLNIKALRPSKPYFPLDIMDFGRRL
jgi:hypothetical protein